MLLTQDRVLATFSELHRLSGLNAFMFLTERGTPLTKRAAGHTVAEAARRAGMGFPVNSHMLRHACGYKLVNDGASARDIQAWLGHTSLNNVTRYSGASGRQAETGGEGVNASAALFPRIYEQPKLASLSWRKLANR